MKAQFETSYLQIDLEIPRNSAHSSGMSIDLTISK